MAWPRMELSHQYRVLGWLRQLIYPAVLGLSLAVAWWLSARWGLAVTTLAVLIGAALTVWALEQLMPHSESWRPSLRNVRVDLTHAIASGGAVAPLLRATLFAGAVAAGSALSVRWGLRVWPNTWPLALQAALAILVADLGAYLGHRFMHATQIGWRIHAVHHSATKLYFLAFARAHPYNPCLTLSLDVVLHRITRL